MVPSMSDASLGKHAAATPSPRSAAAVISLCLYDEAATLHERFLQLGAPVGHAEAGKSGVDVKPTLHEPWFLVGDSSPSLSHCCSTWVRRCTSLARLRAGTFGRPQGRQIDSDRVGLGSPRASFCRAIGLPARHRRLPVRLAPKFSTLPAARSAPDLDEPRRRTEGPPARPAIA